MTSTVARIAYLASDALVDLQLPSPNTSLSAQTFTSLPTIVSVPSGGDPVGASLISFTALANPRTITNLSSLPLVLHFALDGDLSDVLLLRTAIPFFLLSTTAQQAHDNALLVSKLARTEKKAVVHAYYSSAVDTAQEVPEDQVVPFLLDNRLSKHSPAASNGQVYAANGNGVNGRTNGVNGTNGHANGHSNGHTNGHSNGHSEEFTENSAVNDLFKAYEIVALSTVSLVRRPLRPLISQGTSDAETVIFTLGHELPITTQGVSIISVSLVTPLPPSRIIAAIPSTAKRVIVLEHISKWSMKWTPLYLDVVSALQSHEARPIIQSGVFGAVDGITSVDVLKLIQHASTSSPSTRLELSPPSTSTPSNIAPLVPKHEASYNKILAHLFDDRLELANSPSLVASQGEIATTPEFALGRVRAQLEQRQQLINAVQELLQSGVVDVELHSLLSKWILAKDDSRKSKGLGEEIVASLKLTSLLHPAAARILSLRAHFPVVSRWIIGSDAWSYDLGSSGLHHAVASGLNVNVLIIDSLPYSSRNSGEPSRRKHDIGLYAMNHGDVYVASVAVYSSYAQVLQAFTEADRHNGPSVILAYLPYLSDNSPALEVLKETKLAVDSGYWPLYRWDPSKDREGKEPFSLDSDSIKNDLQQFLDRQNHLSQLVRSKPAMATELVSSLGQSVREARKQRAQQSYNELLSSLDAPPLLILYASDGGNAEKKAKRLSHRAQARGLSTTLASFDSMPLDYGDRTLTKLKFSVFAMGDSHYWPRPEDAHYYNKPGKDLDARLEKLGGERIVELGLGDDQDADGPETGYKPWEQLLWKVLGVDSIEITEAEPEPITNEHIKAASQYLRGTIAEGLQDFSTGALAPSDGQLTKFHGIYQQDDRDIRDERQAQGTEPAYSFMIRVRMPGGVCTPEQWRQMDEIADEHGCGTFKITTRATFQFHGVIKRHLKPAIQDINRVLLDTLAACGDVNRNVICSSIPTMSKLHSQVFAFSKAVSEHLIPRTTAYHEIWLDKKMVAGDAVKDFEPLYGEFYLPRKFKVAVAVPPTNDVDVFANDLGFIAIVGDDGELTGFNVSIGGGMGVTHGNKKTYPRAGSIIGFCTPEQGTLVAEKVMLTQRDNGNRADRKNARLKYTIDRMGLDVFKAEVEKRLGYALQPARPFTFDRNIDDYGWATGEDGKHHFLMFIENGRIQDEPGKDFKAGLREIAKVHKGAFRLTANQHLVISDVPNEELPLIKEILAKYKLDNLVHSGLRTVILGMCCIPDMWYVEPSIVGFCPPDGCALGLAMAESERYLPLLIDKVERICENNGLRNDSIVMRMTGCPNGCARPYLGEVAFIGKAPGSYSMLLGGGYYGQRLNKIYRETVTEPEILAILEPMIKRYALERLEGERFGDFTIRAGYISATTSGKEWYVGMGGEGQYKESS
ncbi:sulfite reductase subunit beta [Armillaria borealis]|uniref:assimilatory sulfite reductase (NADPH) n=1 Tax=Armillaria borealis TaxID=47425 RepID=A0AA39JQI9_9AGAR|nr:sulfite reductase subunit beta [Armillaria borealis]